MAEKKCLRCGKELPAAPTQPRPGRPPTWCSQRCRRAAYEERRAAANGAIAVRTEIIEKPIERIIERVRIEKQIEVQTKHPTAAEAAQIVLSSPRACATVLETLAAETREGRGDRYWAYGYARRAAGEFIAAMGGTQSPRR
ncbi:MAG: hypothetical protein FGM52_03070 [Mycobacterium sp.]|nr:hypothetical protein [Mycobacterium sp.]